MKQQDIDDLKKLIDFLKAEGVAEFDVDRGDLKLRLKFRDERPVVAAVPAAAASAVPSIVPAAVDPGLHLVKSPIVGTFYGSSSPGSAAFVSPGDHVEKGQVIGIVEAMKLMNEIEADAAGEIVSCLVSNGQTIEFGQPLFAIRPA